MKYFYIYLYLNIIYINFIKSYYDNSIYQDSNVLPEKCYELCSKIGGICTNDFKCKCKNGYSTNFYEENFIFCDYKQYNKLITGLIELLFGFGFGHFYCERFFYGYLQLTIECILFFFLSLLISVFYYADNILNDGYPFYTNIITNYYFPLMAIILLIWQLIDSILFFSSYFKDGNGINLY